MFGVPHFQSNRAKHEAEAILEAKVRCLPAATAASEVQNNANQAEKLLEEIRYLRRGTLYPCGKILSLGPYSCRPVAR